MVLASGSLTFRSPEKDHAAQLHCFHELLNAYPEYNMVDAGVKLVLVGGSRNAEDAARVDGLRHLAKELGIEVCVLNIIVFTCRSNMKHPPGTCRVRCECSILRNLALAIPSQRWAQHNGRRTFWDQYCRVYGQSFFNHTT